MRDAAQILSYYPDDADQNVRFFLDCKRRQILAALGDIEQSHPHVQRIGDGVKAEVVSEELRLSAQDGDGRESSLLMSQSTCKNLMRYIRHHILCSEEP